MISAQAFLEPARCRGFDFWAGVPCSYLKPFINYVIDDPGLVYVSASNEGDAVATASGAALAGRRAIALMQNSGLGNAVSPLTSLNWVFRIPILLIITLRGDPAHHDEPQHELMGQITIAMLEQMDIAWQWFPDEATGIEPALEQAIAHMDSTGRPFALVMRKDTVEPYPLLSQPAGRQTQWSEAGHSPPATVMPSRTEVLRAMVGQTPVSGSVLIATTGFTGRELYAIDDRPNQLYMVGSMGCASSLGLGLSLCRPDLKVAVADGDGATLMRMGNLATIGNFAGHNFAHVLLDNHMHESTGGQATVSHGVRYADIAAACGYRSAQAAATADEVAHRLARLQGPAFTHVCTRSGVPEGLPRPSIKPADVCRRLMKHLGAIAPWA